MGSIESTRLSFFPSWYNVGDADSPLYATAYGISAIATMWLIEDILQNALLSANSNIHISDMAALVAFRGSSLIEIVRWFTSRWFVKGVATTEPSISQNAKQ